MMLDELVGLLQARRYLPAGDRVEREALRALPELADGLPALTTDPDGVHVWSGCAQVLRAPLAQLVGTLAAAVQAEPDADADARLGGDPLVALIAQLVVEGAAVSPGAAVVPLLEVVRAVAAAQAEPPLAGFHAGEPEVAGVVLGRLAQGVQVRLAAACALAAESVRVPALAWAVARCRLLPIFPRGTLDRDPAYALAAAILGLPLPAGTVESVEAAVRLVVRGVTERRSAGRGTPDDAPLLLRHLGPDRLEAGADAATASLLADPDALAMLLPALARYTDEKALVAAKVDRARAAQLLTPAGGLATASVLGELMAALRTWEVLSALATALAPGPVRSLSAPRGAPTRGTVVAVGLGRLRTAGRGAGAFTRWTELTRGLAGGIATEVGGVGLAIFPEPVDAFRLALEVASRIEGVSVGVAFGPMTGGADGRVVRVAGPAVDNAIQWIAVGPGRAHLHGAGSVGALGTEGGWLVGSGIAIEAAAAEALREAQVRRGLATAVDGPPGGDPRVPRSLDLHRVFELDGEVMALAHISGVAGGYEVLHMPIAEWCGLLDREGERVEPAPRGALATPVEPFDPEPAVAEEGAGWEMAEADEFHEEAPVTLDLEEAAPAQGASSPEPRFDFDEENEDADAGDFSGFYLPSAADAASPAPVAPPVAAAAPSAFDMEVEDEDDDTEEEEWVPPGAPPVPAPARPTAPRMSDVRVDADPFADHDVDAHFTAYAGRGRSSDSFAGDPFADAPFSPDSKRPAASGNKPGVSADPFAATPAAGKPGALMVDPLAPDPFAPGSTAEGEPSPRSGLMMADAFGEDSFASDGADSFADAVNTPDGASGEGTFTPAAPAAGADALFAAPFTPDAFGGDDAAGFGFALADPEPPKKAPRSPAKEPPASPVKEPPASPVKEPPASPVKEAPRREAPTPAKEPREPGPPANDPRDPRPPREEPPLSPEPLRAPPGRPGEPVGEPPGPAPERHGQPSRHVHSGREIGGAGIDFDFLLKGYAWFFEKREAVFGRPYGTRIVDRHVYPFGGDPDAAYAAFLQDKIGEGFVPRADLVGDLPRGVTVMPLDSERLQRAWRAMT